MKKRRHSRKRLVLAPLLKRLTTSGICCMIATVNHAYKANSFGLVNMHGNVADGLSLAKEIKQLQTLLTLAKSKQSRTTYYSYGLENRYLYTYRKVIYKESHNTLFINDFIFLA